jgi:hypothetical protein
MSSLKEVKVQVHSFLDFFKNQTIYPVGIDSYQRPYVWETDKIEELIKDLSEYMASPKGLTYYMGSILLHEHTEKEQLYIIDGQQRLTTLSILYYVLKGKLVENGRMAMSYNSPLSVKNIKIAQRRFEQIKPEWLAKADFLFQNIELTFITTYSEDLAFTFFDTQNNRGVSLSPTDLLKAYHLRAIGDSDSLLLQIDCGKRWEKVQSHPRIYRMEKDFAAELFKRFLWSGRAWKGQDRAIVDTSSDEAILIEFQKNILTNEVKNEIPLFANLNNVFAKKLAFDPNEGFAITPQVIKTNMKSLYLPFTLRQPISKGLGFFLFTEKYGDIIQYLLKETNGQNKEVKAFQEFYKQTWKHLSIYLKELFLLSTVLYYDKFGTERLLEFVLWLDNALGEIRISKRYIFHQAPLKFLTEKQQNLLDVISYAFMPEEVIRHLSSYKTGGYKKLESDLIEEQKKLENQNRDLINIIEGKGVRGRYRASVLSYYEKSNLSNKKTWITQTFINQKIEL